MPQTQFPKLILNRSGLVIGRLIGNTCRENPVQPARRKTSSPACVNGVFLLRSHQFEERITRRDCSTIVYINLEYDATVTCWNMKEDFLCFNDPYDGITPTKVTELNKGSSIRRRCVVEYATRWSVRKHWQNAVQPIKILRATIPKAFELLLCLFEVVLGIVEVEFSDKLLCACIPTILQPGGVLAKQGDITWRLFQFLKKIQFVHSEAIRCRR